MKGESQRRINDGNELNMNIVRCIEFARQYFSLGYYDHNDKTDMSEIIVYYTSPVNRSQVSRSKKIIIMI